MSHKPGRGEHFKSHVASTDNQGMRLARIHLRQSWSNTLLQYDTDFQVAMTAVLTCDVDLLQLWLRRGANTTALVFCSNMFNGYTKYAGCCDTGRPSGSSNGESSSAILCSDHSTDGQSSSGKLPLPSAPPQPPVAAEAAEGDGVAPAHLSDGLEFFVALQLLEAQRAEHKVPDQLSRLLMEACQSLCVCAVDLAVNHGCSE
eukprot:Selendium_serpulae@DN7525_c0_g1_i1.p1